MVALPFSPSKVASLSRICQEKLRTTRNCVEPSLLNLNRREAQGFGECRLSLEEEHL